MRWVVVITALAAVASGCSIGRVYNGSPLRGDPEKLVEGQSTRTEVLKLLGPPDAIEHQTSGDAFVYRYRQVNYSSLTIREPFIINQVIFSYSREFDRRDVLLVLFDYSGVVAGVAYKNDTADLPWL